MATTHDEDLWPDDIAAVAVSPPTAILREQAQKLGPKTNHVLQGEVQTHADPDSARLIISFDIVAPNLEYRYRLFRAVHRVDEFYPIDFYRGALNELAPDDTAQDEQQLREVLKRIFSEERTKRIISALLAQSQA